MARCGLARLLRRVAALDLRDEPLSFGAWQGRARGARRRSPLLLSVGVDVLIVIAFPCFGEDVDILFLGMYV